MSSTRVLQAASIASAVLVAGTAAAAGLEVSTQVSSRQVEVGQELQVQLSVFSDSDLSAPENTRLPVPPGLSVRGPQMGTQSQVSIANGRMTRRAGVNLTWLVTATKPGTYRLGPPSAEFAGSVARGQPISVEVVPAGSRPRLRGGFPFPFDPFDPFGGLGGPRMPGFPPDPDESDSPAAPQVPPEYQVAHAPDPIAFLITKATPREVVMGQVIAFKAYAYGGRGPFEGVDSNEPSREGFLGYPVEQATRVVPVQVPIDGTVFLAAQVSEMVLVPIRTGTLRIGSMRFGFGGRNYPPANGARGQIRQSAPIDVQVVEPPLAGRPVGYRLGDVGNYTLQARVEPRKIRQGDSLSVVATLEGVGNLPSKLMAPQRNGVEFAEPTLTNKVDAENGTLRGARVFSYVVRVDEAGDIDLGELRLPVYNADRKRYEVVRAALGQVTVEPDGSAQRPALQAKDEQDPLKNLLKPRTQLGPAPAKRYLTDSPLFGLWLLGGPALVLIGVGLGRSVRRFGALRQSQRATPQRLARRELELLDEAVRRSDLALVGAGVERAVHFAIEGLTGLKSRGVLRRELGRALVQRGLSPELAQETVALLEAAELARFVTAEADAAGRAPELLAQARQLVNALAAATLRRSERSEG